MSDVIWLNRDEFVRRVQSVSLSVRVQDGDIFSLAGIDTQLSSFDSKGIILLRTKLGKIDLEEFAVRKVNGVWKFSLSADEVEAVKY